MMMELVWGWPIAIYLYLGGISAGAFISTASLDLLSKNPKYGRLLHWGAYISWIPIASGIPLLVYDLGRQERFIGALLIPNLTSPMAWGSLIITLFTVVAFLYASIYFYHCHLPNNIKRRLEKILENGRIERILEDAPTFLAYLGIPLGFMTATYTGILLTVTSIPLWETPTLPAMFLASSLASGFGMFTVIAVATLPMDENEKFFINVNRVDLTLVIIDLTTVLAFIGSILIMEPTRLTQNLTELASLSGYGFFFWSLAVFLGDAIPMSIGIFEIFKKHPMITLLILVANLDMMGGFALKFIVVYAGQPLVIYA